MEPQTLQTLLPTDGALLVFLVALGLVIGSRTWDRGLMFG